LGPALGRRAQVLAPEALRQIVSRHAAAMAAYYQDAPADEDGQASNCNPRKKRRSR
jgi:hypothetical protein